MPVYAIAALGQGLVKLGKAGNVARRLAGLQTASPVPLTLLKVFDGYADEELELHERFAAHRHHGEWFELAPIRDALDRITIIEKVATLFPCVRCGRPRPNYIRRGVDGRNTPLCFACASVEKGARRRARRACRDCGTKSDKLSTGRLCSRCGRARWDRALSESALRRKPPLARIRSRGSVHLSSLALPDAEIAGRIGVSRVTANRWHRGHTTPPAPLREALAREFGIPCHEWLVAS